MGGTLTFLSTFELFAQKTVLQPTPQEYTVQGDSFSLPDTYRLISDAGAPLAPALSLFRKRMPGKEAESEFTVYIGKKGDKSIKKYQKFIPLKAEGYYLEVTPDRIVIAGADARGVYYGVQTLVQLLAGETLLPTQITDYPDVPYRGVVEGFYGTPWSHEARMSQLEFYGRNKMNVYLYGPKNDPYHSTPNWRKPYPTEEAERLKELVDKAHECNVIFYWAIHPGQDIRWNDEDRDLLIQKFESMYRLGVRGFAVFFDDISGKGTAADKQAELLNYIDENFIKAKEDVAPLIMCPTAYNRGRSERQGDYLATLGSKLNKDIEVMWTGRRVLSDIDKGVTDFVNPVIRRKAYIWWNFPVSDYIFDHLLLGPVYGNGKDIADDLAGFVSNPMEHAEASKIALYGVADYTWNMEDYDSRAAWKRALHDLMPQSGDYLETFATHNSGLKDGDFVREESENIRPHLETLLQDSQAGKSPDEDAWKTVDEECDKIIIACNMLLASGNENRALINEIEPWIKMTKSIGEYGKTVLRMIKASNDRELFARRHAEAQAALTLISETDADCAWGVKSASLHLMPTLNALFETETARYNRQFHTLLNEKAEYTPYSVDSDVEQLADLTVHRDGKRGDVASVLETVLWQEGGSFTFTLDYPRALRALSVDLKSRETAALFKLETSSDGSHWEEAELTSEKGGTVFGCPLDKRKVLKIRLTNISGKQQEIHFKRFRVTEL